MASQRERNIRKVGLVGAGMVGSSFAYALMQRSLASELVIVDIDHDRAVGEAMDLNHGLPFVRTMRIRAGDYPDLADADVIVITAGSNQRPGETRLDLLQRNARIVRLIVPQIVAVNRSAVIVVASNPVDILAHIAHEEAGLPWGQVIGSGTILDTARLRFLLSEHYGVDSRNVHAYMVGEHGDSGLALWSSASVAGVLLPDFVGSNGVAYDETALEAILNQTRNAAYEIIKRKNATYYAIGLGLVSLLEGILRDQHTVMTVSTPMDGQHGVDGIAISLPTIVGRYGAEKVLNIPLSEAEIAGFQHSAQLLKDKLATLDTPDTGQNAV